MEYNVDYFIGKFSAIPEDKWTTFAQHENGKFCALVHCGTEEEKTRAIRSKLNNVILNYNAEYQPLFEMFFVLPFKIKHAWASGRTSPAHVNNGVHLDYQQPTPKQRILAALHDIKAMQEAEKTPKERIVYVTVDEPVRKLQKELELN